MGSPATPVAKNTPMPIDPQAEAVQAIEPLPPLTLEEAERLIILELHALFNPNTVLSDPKEVGESIGQQVVNPEVPSGPQKFREFREDTDSKAQEIINAIVVRVSSPEDKITLRKYAEYAYNGFKHRNFQQRMTGRDAFFNVGQAALAPLVGDPIGAFKSLIFSPFFAPPLTEKEQLSGYIPGSPAWALVRNNAEKSMMVSRFLDNLPAINVNIGAGDDFSLFRELRNMSNAVGANERAKREALYVGSEKPLQHTLYTSIDALSIFINNWRIADESRFIAANLVNSSTNSPLELDYQGQELCNVSKHFYDTTTSNCYESETDLTKLDFIEVCEVEMKGEYDSSTATCSVVSDVKNLEQDPLIQGGTFLLAKYNRAHGLAANASGSLNMFARTIASGNGTPGAYVGAGVLTVGVNVLSSFLTSYSKNPWEVNLSPLPTPKATIDIDESKLRREQVVSSLLPSAFGILGGALAYDGNGQVDQRFAYIWANKADSLFVRPLDPESFGYYSRAKPSAGLYGLFSGLLLFSNISDGLVQGRNDFRVFSDAIRHKGDKREAARAIGVAGLTTLSFGLMAYESAQEGSSPVPLITQGASYVASLVGEGLRKPFKPLKFKVHESISVLPEEGGLVSITPAPNTTVNFRAPTTLVAADNKMGLAPNLSPSVSVTFGRDRKTEQPIGVVAAQLDISPDSNDNKGVNFGGSVQLRLSF